MKKIVSIVLGFVAIVTLVCLPRKVYLGEEWKTLTTKYTTIHFQADEDVKELSMRIDFGPKGELAEKVDGLFDKVRDILDMRRNGMGVIIEVYRDQHDLDTVYQRITNLYLPPPIAFYFYPTNTIYLSLHTVNERVLAHEMAHCVIHYFTVINLPDKVGELLAHYVEENLND